MDNNTAKLYFTELKARKDQLLSILKWRDEGLKNRQIDEWKTDAFGSAWINWPFNKERPENEAVAQHLGEILQITNGIEAVHRGSTDHHGHHDEEDDAEDVEYHVEPDVPTNYNAIVSNLSKEQKKWIKVHYDKVLVLSSGVPKGLNDYNEILKEIFKFYKL
jgi:hypothetical protein